MRDILRAALAQTEMRKAIEEISQRSGVQFREVKIRSAAQLGWLNNYVMAWKSQEGLLYVEAMWTGEAIVINMFTGGAELCQLLWTKDGKAPDIIAIPSPDFCFVWASHKGEDEIARMVAFLNKVMRDGVCQG